MRITGAILYRPQLASNERHITNDKTIKILTVGESTTADYWSSSEEGSWPRQLDKMLKSKGYNAKVINVAKGGVQSSFILSDVDMWIDKYNPDIVISMMGINDNRHTYYQQGDNYNFSGLKSFVFSLKLVKLSYWVFEAVNNLIHKKFSIGTIRWLTYEQRDNVPQFAKDFNKYNLDIAFEKVRVKAAGNKCVEALYLSEIITKLRGDNDFSKYSKLKDKLVPMAVRALTLCPTNHDVMYISINTLGIDHDTCRKMILQVTPYIKEIEQDIWGSMSYCFDEIKDIPDLIFYELGKRNISLNLKLAKNEVTAHHYRTLFDKLNLKSIKLIAMQYPTVSLSPLRGYFVDRDGEWIKPDYQNIILVENRDNFLKALSIHSYDQVFMDSFNKSWGHTTFFGHELIAKQVLTEVERIIKNRSK